jgi:membrane-bound ClpP family serine protease
MKNLVGFTVLESALLFLLGFYLIIIESQLITYGITTIHGLLPILGAIMLLGGFMAFVGYLWRVTRRRN